MTDAEEERLSLYIIDAYSMIFRVFHGTTEVVSPKGVVTNAVFGTYRELRNILRDHRPDYWVAAFDSPEPNFRSEIYPEYKANRPEKPKDLIPQFPLIKEVVRAFGMPIVEQPGMEADDLIASLAKRGQRAGLNVTILSGDKDLRQLLSKQVQMYSLRKNQVINEQVLMDEWGIKPNQVIDFLSMTGDTVDNIPGIPGIGKTYATKYLQQFGTLDKILANPEEIREPGKRKIITENAESAYLARKLVALKDDLTIDLDWVTMEARDPDEEALERIANQCGFAQLVGRYRVRT